MPRRGWGGPSLSMPSGVLLDLAYDACCYTYEYDVMSFILFYFNFFFFFCSCWLHIKSTAWMVIHIGVSRGIMIIIYTFKIRY